MQQIAENVVKTALALYQLEQMQRLNLITSDLQEVKARVIGIDGDGTGRKGSIQVLGDKVDTLLTGIQNLKDNEREKEGARKYRANMKAIFMTLTISGLGVAGVILGEWVKHRMGW